jgi:hypothetical protein
MESKQPCQSVGFRVAQGLGPVRGVYPLIHSTHARQWNKEVIQSVERRNLKRWTAIHVPIRV